MTKSVQEITGELSKIIQSWGFESLDQADSWGIILEKLLPFLRFADEALGTPAIGMETQMIAEEEGSVGEFIALHYSTRNIACNLTEDNAARLSSGEKVALGLTVLSVAVRENQSSVLIEPERGGFVAYTVAPRGKLPQPLRPYDERAMTRLGWKKDADTPNWRFSLGGHKAVAYE